MTRYYKDGFVKKTNFGLQCQTLAFYLYLKISHGPKKNFVPKIFFIYKIQAQQIFLSLKNILSDKSFWSKKNLLV